MGAKSERSYHLPCTIHNCSAAAGGIDVEQRAHGYQNLIVCDGSVIPANLGANPALSILAFAERAMASLPLRAGAAWRPLAVDRAWGVEGLLRRP